MGFLSSLFTGSNPTLSGTMAKTGQISDYSSNLGQSSTTQGSNFFSSILSGDPTKIAQSMAPQISTAQKGAQQQKNQISQFGNRSGGSASAGNSIDASTRGSIINAVGGAQSGAASSLLNSGQSLLGQALGGYGQQAQLSQQQADDWSHSLFGGALTGGAGIGLASLAKKAGVAGLFA